MALIYMETDTGGGANNGSNASKVVKYNTPSAASYAQGQAALQKRLTPTANKSNAKKSATTTPAATQQTVTPTANNGSYYNNYNTNYVNTYNPKKDEGPSVASQNNNAYLSLLNDLATMMHNDMYANSGDYATDTNKYFNTAQNQAKSAYDTNKSLYDQLSAENAQRQTAATQYATDYYNRVNAENKAKEAATLNAINEAYNNIMGNASEYYNNLLGTYNRSMDYVNQGFNEGNAATQQARDEAIRLAAELYAMGEQSQNRQTERDLKSQYVSYMNGLKNMNQRLAAQGINGGASETAQLGALNGYESNRTDLEEARLAALGALRQTQMQSDSEANQAYLAKLADLIANRTNQQLGVENNRSQGELSYANMKNDAASQRGNQMVTAQNNFQNWASALENAYANMGITNQNNFQNWASDLTSQRAANENSYANAIADIASGRAGAAYNETVFENQASQAPADIYTSAAYENTKNQQNEAGEKANIGNASDLKTTEEQKKEAEKKKKEKEKKKKEEEKKKKAINNAVTAAKTATTTTKNGKTTTTTSNTKKKKK